MTVSHSSENQFDQIVAAQEAEWGDPMVAAVEKKGFVAWTLDKEGLAIKACAAKGVDGTRYGLIIARRGEDGMFDDPRNLTRAQLEVVRDFVAFVLEDTRD